MEAQYDAQDRYDRESDVYKKGMETYRNSMLMSSKVREMPLDGAYSFMLEPRGSRSMPALSVTIVSDRTAPEAVFEGLDENMSTKEKAVTVSCKDLEAELMLGNEVLTLKDGKAQITGSGEYTLTVSDPAGNKNEYKFILDSENVKKGLPVWLIVILVIVAIILAVIIIMVIGNIISGMSGHSKKDKDKGNADNTDDDWESGSSEDTGDDWESGSFTDDDDIWGSGNFSDKGGSYDNASDDGENTDDDDWENG